MKKAVIVLVSVAFLTGAGTASAHVTVKPAEAGVASFQIFTVSVPVEKDLPTTQVRLVLPEGLEYVMPTVKQGWRIDTVKKKAAQEAPIEEIIWRGGQIPNGFRDEFTFSAKVPAQAGDLNWKAYQTYRDGSVVSWDLLPGTAQPKNASGTPDFSEKGPASVTKIVDDLSAKPQPPVSVKPAWSVNPNTLLLVSFLSLCISLFTLAMGLTHRRKTKKK